MTKVARRMVAFVALAILAALAIAGCDFFPKGGARMVTFAFYEVDNPSLGGVNVVADVLGTRVTAVVPAGTELFGLVPTIVLVDGATVDPASGVPQDFQFHVTYTVTASDGVTTSVYTVNVETADWGM